MLKTRASKYTALAAVFLLFMVAASAVASVMIPIWTGAAIVPTMGTTSSSWAQFRSSSPFAQNFVIDRPRLWVPLTGGYQGVVASLVGYGTGTPAAAEVNTSEMGGWYLDADDESVSIYMPFPADLDPAKDIRIRALCSNHEAAGTGTYQIVFTYELYTAGTTALSVPNDAMDTDGAAQADLAANVLQWTNWSTITGGTISLSGGQDIWAIKTEAQLTTVAAVTCYGIQVEYYRKFLDGSVGN